METMNYKGMVISEEEYERLEDEVMDELLQEAVIQFREYKEQLRLSK